ncbi:MAG: GntR family transcriptional regulator [Chthoniobacterales bacterium]
MSSHALQRGKSRAQYLYRQISERIRKEIEEGKIAPLGRLPSMDELAKRHDVNKITVRKALAELRAEGLIYSVPAQGTFVADPSVRENRRVRATMTSVGIVGHVLRKESLGPYHLEILAGIQTELSRQHAALVILPAGELRKEEDYIRLVQQAHVDAVIYLGPIAQPILGHLIRQGPPAVVADAPEGYGNADVICFDNAAGARVAAEHLYEMGHRRLAIVTGDKQVASREREQAAIDYWTSRGIPAGSIRRIHGDFSRESGMRAGEQLLRGKDMPTGIFCLNDEMAVGLLVALQTDARYRVPQDVSVIGFDDIFWAASSVPALTTVRVDKCLMGRLAAQRVLERMQEPSLPATYIRVEPLVVLRNSTASGPAKIGPDLAHA